MAFYYKQKIDSVSSYRRCFRIDGANTYEEIPTLTFHEEVVTIGSDQTLIANTPTGMPLAIAMNNPAFQNIPLISPDTGLPVPGKMVNVQELYLGLYSLYFALAQARDKSSP